MDLERVKDVLTIVTLGGALTVGAVRFFGNVNQVPEHAKQLKNLHRRVGKIERQNTFLVSGMEKLTRQRFVDRAEEVDE